MHGKYIILCNFGGHFLSGFKVIEGAPDYPPPRSQGAKKKNKKKTVWIGLNTRDKPAETKQVPTPLWSY